MLDYKELLTEVLEAIPEHPDGAWCGCPDAETATDELLHAAEVANGIRETILRDEAGSSWPSLARWFHKLGDGRTLAEPFEGGTFVGIFCAAAILPDTDIPSVNTLTKDSNPAKAQFGLSRSTKHSFTVDDLSCMLEGAASRQSVTNREVKVGGVLLSAKLFHACAVLPATLASDDQVTIWTSGPLESVLVVGSTWKSIVMPLRPEVT